MSTLHLISSPSAVKDCLLVLDAADEIVLLGDGVYAGQDLGLRNYSVKMVADDLKIRGLAATSFQSATAIEYLDLVELCVAHQPIVSWG